MGGHLRSDNSHCGPKIIRIPKNTQKQQTQKRSKLIGSGDYTSVAKSMKDTIRNEINSQVKPAVKKALVSTGSYLGGKLAKATGLKESDIREKGRNIARKLSKLIGSGDYAASDTPTVNSLFPGSRAVDPSASFDCGTNGFTFSGRDYIGDIYAGANGTFTTTSFPVQPGLRSSFATLSNLAPNFEEYYIHGLVYEFESSTSPYLAGGAMGSIVLAMEYNASSTAFVTKGQMENSDFAVSARPDRNMMYGVECKDQPLNGRYVRTIANSTGLPVTLSDMGIFTVGVQNTTITSGTSLGELYASYLVTLRKPKISPANFGYIHWNFPIASAGTNLTPDQSTQPSGPNSTMGCMYGAYTSNAGGFQKFYFPNATIGDIYSCQMSCYLGGSATFSALVNPSLTNLVPYTIYNNSTLASSAAPSVGGLSTSYTFIATYQVTSDSTVPFISLTPGTLAASETQVWDVIFTCVGNSIATASL